jgi:hypothetical protein
MTYNIPDSVLPVRTKLRAVMAAHGLRAADVARLTERSVHTVTSWLKPPGGASHRAMPPSAWSLLMERLEARE